LNIKQTRDVDESIFMLESEKMNEEKSMEAWVAQKQGRKKWWFLEGALKWSLDNTQGIRLEETTKGSSSLSWITESYMDAFEQYNSTNFMNEIKWPKAIYL